MVQRAAARSSPWKLNCPAARCASLTRATRANSGPYCVRSSTSSGSTRTSNRAAMHWTTAAKNAPQRV